MAARLPHPTGEARRQEKNKDSINRKMEWGEVSRFERNFAGISIDSHMENVTNRSLADNLADCIAE